MIWCAGRIMRDEDLKISVQDRTFEHGLGLFETFRTWNGNAVLLDRHLARLQNSARSLNLPLNPEDLPSAEDIFALASKQEDSAFRITVSGGLASGEPCTVWMSARPLPPEPHAEGFQVLLSTTFVNGLDALARHKSLNYWSRRIAYEQAVNQGADEALLRWDDPADEFPPFEGSRTSLFAVHGDTLITPDLGFPIVPGIMRQVVLEFASASGLRTIEIDDDPARMGIIDGRADEVFLTNSVRGVIPVCRVLDQDHRVNRKFPSLGTVTRLIREGVLHRLCQETIRI